ncbi:MAG: hypothetical protein WCO58_02855 [bacterium]
MLVKRKHTQPDLGVEAAITLAPGLEKEFKQKQKYNNKQRQLFSKRKPK